MKNVLFAGYRSWAIQAYDCIPGAIGNPVSYNFLGHRSFTCTNDADKETVFHLVTTPKYLNAALVARKHDVIFLVGWSWIVPDEVILSTPTYVYHPSDLPEYAGGSPLQHQIMDGVTKTKATLFRATPGPVDSGPIVGKTDLDLSGNMSDVFGRLAHTACLLVGDTLKQWPDVKEVQQASLREPKRRLRPEDSVLKQSDLLLMSALDLYNFIRCHADPYPNVCIEDETGRLTFKNVEFEPKKA